MLCIAACISYAMATMSTMWRNKKRDEARRKVREFNRFKPKW
jgi:hypothetical protein